MAVPEIHSLSATRGAAWFREGWKLFSASPGLWIALTVIWFALVAAASTVPGGNLIVSLFSPVLIGGFMLGCDIQTREQQLGIEHVFAGFKTAHVGPLLGIGAFSIAASIAIAAVTAIVAVLVIPDLQVYFKALIRGLGTPLLAMDWRDILLIVLIGMVLYVPLMMAMWLAPALVVLNGLGPVTALRGSFFGCLRNVMPFLIYGLIGICLMLLSAITLFLALIVLVPVFITSMYTAYTDIFTTAADDDVFNARETELYPDIPGQ